AYTPQFSPFFFHSSATHPHLHSFPTRRSSDLLRQHPIHIEAITFDRPLLVLERGVGGKWNVQSYRHKPHPPSYQPVRVLIDEVRSEEHTSELQSRENLVCRLLLEKKKKKKTN